MMIHILLILLFIRTCLVWNTNNHHHYSFNLVSWNQTTTIFTNVDCYWYYYWNHVLQLPVVSSFQQIRIIQQVPKQSQLLHLFPSNQVYHHHHHSNCNRMRSLWNQRQYFTQKQPFFQYKNTNNNNEHIDNDPLQEDDDNYGKNDTEMIQLPPFLQPSSSQTSSLYPEDTLQRLLDLHGMISDEMVAETTRMESQTNDTNMDEILSLHDFIVQSLQEQDECSSINNSNNNARITNDTGNNVLFHNDMVKSSTAVNDGEDTTTNINDRSVAIVVEYKKTEETSSDIDDNNKYFTINTNKKNMSTRTYNDLQEKISKIRVIACDIDGTLLSSSSTVTNVSSNDKITNNSNNVRTKKTMFMHPRTQRALYNAIQFAYFNSDNSKEHERHENDVPTKKNRYFLLATGKTRKGAISSIIQGCSSNNNNEYQTKFQQVLYKIPGVYIQGLYCVNANGTIVYEQKLPSSSSSTNTNKKCIVQQVEELILSSPNREQMTIVGYDGDTLYVNPNICNPILYHQIYEMYGEPIPIVLSNGTTLATNINNNNNNNTVLNDGSNECTGYHKLLIMDHDPIHISTIIRPPLESIAKLYNCTVTQSVSNMLEVLPYNCSKGNGILQLLQYLEKQEQQYDLPEKSSTVAATTTTTTTIIDPYNEMLSIGDAENDIDMFHYSSISVTVQNASPIAKQVSDITMIETNINGGAGRAIELFSTFL